jgi:hypothetical protein
LQLRRLEDAPMFAVDDLTAGLTLKSQSELLGNSVPVRTDPPCRDNAAIADFHPAAAERPVAILAASEGVQMPLNDPIVQRT